MCSNALFLHFSKSYPWSQVSMKPVLNNFMRRLDKSLTKIHKNQRIYVSTDWSAVSTLLRGLYQVILASHWSRVILRPDTGLSLVQSDHLT